jgi:hypothetical protein
LHWTKRQVAAYKRALHTATHGLADDKYLFQRDFERVGMTPQIDTDRVSHGNELHAGAIRNPGNLIIPGDDANALLSVALHLLERKNGGLVRHPSLSQNDRHRFLDPSLDIKPAIIARMQT